MGTERVTYFGILYPLFTNQVPWKRPRLPKTWKIDETAAHLLPRGQSGEAF